MIKIVFPIMLRDPGCYRESTKRRKNGGMIPIVGLIKPFRSLVFIADIPLIKCLWYRLDSITADS